MNFYSQQSANPLIIRYQLSFIMSLVFVTLFLALFIEIEVWNIIQKAISDAYIQVTTFVAATLIIFYSLEKYFKFDLSSSNNENKKLTKSLFELLHIDQTPARNS